MAGMISIDPAELEKASAWLRNAAEELQRSLQEAYTKLAAVISAAYSAPGSKAGFKPYWEEYNTGVEQAVAGLRGVDAFLQVIADSSVARTRGDVHKVGDVHDIRDVRAEGRTDDAP